MTFDGETILQDVLVLAAGQIFSRPDERAVQSRTVTLALSPGDVDILVAAGRAVHSRSRSEASMTTTLVEQRKPEPKVDPEAEKQWKLAEEARQKLEGDWRS